MQFGVLGPLAVWRDGEPIQLGGLRVRMLLARLLLDAGRTVSAARLIDELWGESPPAGAANALQSLVSRLRTAIEPVAVELAPGGYRLDVAPEAVDAARFELLAAEGRRALAGGDPWLAADRLREALALWRGEPLADLAGGGFTGAAVARLCQLRLAAVQDRIEAELATGRAAELLAELTALVAAHPLDERLRGLLMRSLYAAGRQADALALFADTRRLLADELGVDPSPDLDRLHTEMLRRSPGLSGAAPGTGALRAQLTSFVGREEAVEQVTNLLASRRLVTLVGPGGTGKTRLAVELAARDRSRARLIELAPLSDPDDVPQAVLAALGAREAGLIERGVPVRDPIARVSSALADKPLLLVLDNCEHLIDAAAHLVAAVLAAGPELRVLATSREPLGVAGESLWPVPPLELPPQDVDAAAAPGYPAVRLFLDRAAAVRPGVVLDEHNVAAVAQVCRRLDGMPLAIELAAARLRSLTVEQVAERLDDRFALLTGGSRTALPRHQTLRALVDWSWELLEEHERVLLRRLSVFSGGATVETAERVCSGGGLLPGAVLDLLSRLVDRSLLEAVPSATRAMRYRLLETVRAYAVERLAEAGEEHAVRRAYAEHFCALAESAAPALHGPEQLAWLTRLRAEHDNLQAALRWALDAGEAALAQRLAVALQLSYWALSGYRAQAGSRVRAAVALTGDVPVAVRAATQTALAWVAIDEGNVQHAVAPYQAARELSLESGERPHPVLAILDPVLSYLAAGDEGRARAGLERVQADAGADGWIRATALMLLGTIDVMAGRQAEAEAHLAAAAERSRETGDRWSLAQTLARLSEMAENRGDLGRAEAALLEALEQIEPLEAREDLAWLRIRLGVVRSLAGDDAGLELIGAGIDGARDVGAMESASMGLHYAAAIARRRGHLAAARRDYEESLRIMEAMQASAWSSTYPVVGLGFVAELEGDAEGAEAWHRRALRSLAGERPTGPWNRLMVAEAVEGLAGAAALAGRAERAAELLGAAAAMRGPAPIPILHANDTERIGASAREQLGADRFERARRRGQAMTLEEVLEVTA